MRSRPGTSSGTGQPISALERPVVVRERDRRRAAGRGSRGRAPARRRAPRRCPSARPRTSRPGGRARLTTRAFVSSTSWIPISNLTISLLGHELLLSVDQSRQLLQRLPQLDRAALEPRAVRVEAFEQRLGRRVQKRLDLVERDVELAQAAGSPRRRAPGRACTSGSPCPRPRAPARAGRSRRSGGGCGWTGPSCGRSGRSRGDGAWRLSSRRA